MAPRGLNNSAGQARPGPGQPGFQPNQRQRVGYTEALRRLLGSHTVHNFLLQRHLVVNDWNVAAAFASYTAEHTTRQGSNAPAQPGNAGAATSAAPNAPPSPATSSQNPAVPSTMVIDTQTAVSFDLLPNQQQSIEQERRDTAVVFRDQVRAMPSDAARLSISEAILLLHLADWDLGKAIKDWRGLDDARDRLHVAFDRMRSPEGPDLPCLAEDRARMERQDERLAVLLDVTIRPDWRSVQEHLLANQFDLVAAVVRWFKTGIAKVKKAKDQKLTRKDTRMNAMKMPSDDDVKPPQQVPDGQWAAEPTFFRQVKDFDRLDLIPEPPLREDEDSRTKRPFGFLLGAGRETIQAGRYFLEDHFVVEYISKGRYWHNRFVKKTVGKGGAPFKWPKLGQGTGPAKDGDVSSSDDGKNAVVFDFNDSAHVHKLNAWRRQQFSRATGVLKRKGSQAWQDVENAMLYQLLKELYEAHTKSQAGLADDKKSPVKITERRLQEVTDLLNEAFTGTRPGNATAVRGERTAHSVGTQARRFLPNIEDLGINSDADWFNKKRKISKEDFAIKQRKALKNGQTQLKTWDAAALRPAATTTTATTAADAADSSDYEQGVLSGDDEATKERKRHETRALSQVVKKAQKAAAGVRARRAVRKQTGEKDDEEGPDVLGKAGKAAAVSDNEDSENEGADEDGNEDDGKKRKRDEAEDDEGEHGGDNQAA